MFFRYYDAKFDHLINMTVLDLSIIKVSLYKD